MLLLKMRSTPAKVELEDLPRVMMSLGESGEWVPALHRSRTTVLELAELDVADASVLAPAASPLGGKGDVCFRGEDTFSALRTEKPDILEVGLITPTAEGADNRLELFAATVESAVLGSLDGRKTRHMKFEWVPPVHHVLLEYAEWLTGAFSRRPDGCS